jgi:antitoxin VapB
VSLNIKDEATHALVRELARLTGSSQTAAVRDAVRRRLDELSRLDDETTQDQRRADVLRLVAEFQQSLTEEERRRMRNADEGLYDERGLPR